VEETVDGELEVHHFIAPGLTSYFSPPKIPSFPALFAGLAGATRARKTPVPTPETSTSAL